jgi:outer membrane immunogenic protein
MTKMRRFLLAAAVGLAALAVAGPSSAADLGPAPYKAPAPVWVAPVFSWTGFYAGVNGGYEWGTTNFGIGDFGSDGWLFGGTLGYNWQTGNWVWGLEGDIDYSSAKASIACCELKSQWLGTIRGRVGYAWDRFMPYITGGGAAGDVKMSTAGGSESDTKFGWTLGGGVEWAFAGPWSAKLEYLYVDLGDASCSAAVCGASTDVPYHTNLVRGGVNYRF